MAVTAPAPTSTGPLVAGLPAAAVARARRVRPPVDPAVSPALVGLGTLGGAVVLGAATRFGALAAVGVVAAVALGLLFALRPDIAAVTMAVVVPVAAGVRRGLPVPGFRPSELLVVLAAVAVLGPHRREAPRWRAFDWAALTYVVLTVAFGVGNAVLRGNEMTADDLGKMANPLQFLLLYRVVLVGCATPAVRARALRGALWVSVPVALVGVAQQLGATSVQQWQISLTGSVSAPGTDNNLDVSRATGTFAHWHTFAGYLAIVVALAVAVLLANLRADRGDGPRDRPIMGTGGLAVVLVAAGLGLVASVTFVAIFGAVAVTLILATMNGRLRQALIGMAVVAAAGALVALPQLSSRIEQQFGDRSGGRTGAADVDSVVPENVAARFDLWSEQYQLVEPNLLTGYGPGWEEKLGWRWSDSQYVTFLLRGGIPLVASFAVLAGALWARARDASAGAEPVPHTVGQALVALVPVMLVMLITNPYFTDQGFPHVLWVAAALLGTPAALGPRRWRSGRRQIAAAGPLAAPLAVPAGPPVGSSAARSGGFR